jgi:micrococcal nuclease
MLSNRASCSKRWLQTLQALVISLLLASPALAANKLLSVYDGDTFRVQQDDGQVVKVRLWGVDTPEIDQPQGKEAQLFTEALLKAGAIELDCIGRKLRSQNVPRQSRRKRPRA